MITIFQFIKILYNKKNKFVKSIIYRITNLYQHIICKSYILPTKTILEINKISNNIKVHFIKSQRFTNVCKPLYFPNQTYLSHEIKMTPTYWAEINNGIVIGESNYIIADNHILHDQILHENINYTDTAFLDKRNIYRINKINKIYYNYSFKKNIPIAISLVCNYSWNYYHFVFECLSKLWLLSQCNIPKEIPIIIDACIKKIPQYTEYLNILNERNIIYINRKEGVKVKKVFYLSAVNNIVPNYINIKYITYKDNLLDIEYIKFIRNKMLFLFKNKYDFNKTEKVFITRKNNPNRSYNEVEIEDCIKNYGYISIEPQLYSLKEQIRIFSEANCIIAASGAALTNIIYCKEKCKVIILTGYKGELSIFSNIADALNIELIYLSGKPYVNNNIQTGFNIEINNLKKILTSIVE